MSEQNKNLQTTDPERRRFLRLAAGAALVVLAAACDSKSGVTEMSSNTVPTTEFLPATTPTSTTEVMPTTTVEAKQPTFKEPPVIERVANKKFASVSFLAPNSALDGVSYDLATETPNNPEGPELNVGAGWEWNYQMAAQPGAKGNAVIFGHRTTHGGRFRRIDTLDDTESKIQISYNTGEEYSFRVIEEVIVDESDTAAIYTPPQTMQNPDTRMLTLYACHPEGSSRQRILVRAVID